MALDKTLAILAATCIGLCGISPARAADPPSPGLRMPDSMLSLRDMYPDLGSVPDAPARTREYQPREPSILATVPPAPRPDARGELPVSSPWQRLGDFRSANSIRLLTLWQAAAGTIALHEGKHGSTMLQWTSHDLARGAATRGLLDHLVATVRLAHPPLRVAGAASPGAREPVALRAVFYP